MNRLIENLIGIVGKQNVLYRPDELIVYECDGLPQHKHRPAAVVFPESTEQTAAIMRELARARVPFTPRGAGTGLSGGALALNDGVIIELARMRKILKIDVANHLAVVQPGVVNLQVSKAVGPYGLYYVPDPSSQPTCTIGGNIAESAGGIHCLKYGTTTDHVLGCRVVLASGEVVELGGAGVDSPGYDLLGLFVGSEGTFGIATEATLKLVPIPPAVRTLLAEFAEVNDASHAVSSIIAAGVMPAALEMMDHEIIRAVEASVFAAGLPPDAGAALLIELDGLEAGLDDEADRVTQICREHHASNCRRARDDDERKKLWAARKGAFGAIGRISPDSMIQDAVVPRSRLPEVLSAAYSIAGKYQLLIANVFHAGDGNLHPLICFDSRSVDQVRRVKEAGRELMQACVAAGGTITGEHGVGLDKRDLLPLVFSNDDMSAMLRVRAAFDPTGMLNPGKIIPLLRGCGEGGAARSSNAETEQTEEQLPFRGNLPSPAPEHFTPVVRGQFAGDTAFNQLSELCGVDNITLDNEQLVVTPADIGEVSEIMKLANSERWRVSALGGRSLRNISHESANILISTARLNKILEHEPADLIAIAEAGVRLNDFNAVLTSRGQWLPLDPPDDGRATIGGVVATGLGGSQQFGYGRPRASVIGMKVVLSDGSVIKAGGRVVKNVAGYDLCKLFTGSYGTLGIVAEVNFKLRPRPQQERTIVLSCKHADLIATAHKLLAAHLFPVAIELVSSALANRLGITNNNGSAALLVRFAGNKKGVDYQTQATLSHLNSNNHRAEVIAADAQLWDSLAALAVEEQIGWRASVLRGNLTTFINTVSKCYGESFEGLPWHAGLGTGHLTMLAHFNTPESVEAVQRATTSIGGSLTLLGHSKIHPPTGNALAQLSRRIKMQLDPNGIFSPL